MTSRPALGSSQRSHAPPRSSLSSANVVPRPPPHRSLSHQFSPSTSRRTNESVVDLTLDGQDAAALGRYNGTIPRNGGSRLKLEISKDARDSGLTELPKVATSATPTWRPGLPPRGRPHLHFDVPSVSNLSPRAALDGGRSPAPIKPMPLPERPGHHAPPPSDKARSARAAPAKKDARPKPYVLDVPATAPHYSPNGHADFFPWTGNHPEDQFSETVIRQGHFDKAQMTQNETGSGRPSIYPALKHKSGLQTLSSLFTSVIAQRRTNGQITSNSTFKPPPRVTVTDTKREMWLKDLANPTISLRRLSRSIPHGIRGKVLLDQSLSKNIPIERAAWLAKCVGANELRSFRRKGVSGTFAMGGEAKWIRDFTVCVEQFVESVIGACGEKDFNSRINYAIRLSAHFYAKYLLDREHYMDWLVSSFENSSQAKLPMWLLITRVYWKDLMSYRKYGRRLSAALLGHLSETLNQPDQDVLAPLTDRLKSSLKELMASKPESFILSQSWMKHREIIHGCLTTEDDRFAAIFNSIDRRNRRVVSAQKKDTAPRRRIIEFLDTTFLQPPKPEILLHSLTVRGGKSVLLQTLLDWSTSSYRPGHAKIFVAARIIRVWSKVTNADFTHDVLAFLGSEECEVGRCKPALYHLVSELARSGHFSIPLYMQWLIARGGICDEEEVSVDGPCATRLLAELPTQNLSEGLISLRKTLLNRAGFLVGDEEEQIMTCMLSINATLPNMQANLDQEMDLDKDREVTDPERFVSDLSRTGKSEVGLWLRQKVGLQIIQPSIPALNEWDASPMKSGTSAVSAADFNLVRTYLEALEDYSMLADVLKMASSSNDPDVLASCANTLNMHLDIFAAIGALKGLFDILMTRLRVFAEGADRLPGVFLSSLADLAARVPEQHVTAQQLAQEVLRNDQKSAADACSPVSDHMVGVAQTSESNFAEEIERSLASGNSMDPATLERLFQRIVHRLVASLGKSPDLHRNCTLLLSRLRTFNSKEFDVLISAWVVKFLQMQNGDTVQLLAPLVSLGCLSLHDAIAALSPLLDKQTSLSAVSAARLSREALALVFAPTKLPNIMTFEEAYRFRIKQEQMHKDRPLDILLLLRRALEDGSNRDGENSGAIDIRDTYDKQATLLFLKRLALVDSASINDILVKPLLQSSDAASTAAIDSLVDGLLATDSHSNHKKFCVGDVLDIADDLTLPFCQLKLTSIFSNQTNILLAAEIPPPLAELDAAIESAVTAGRATWACVIPLLEVPVAQHLRQRAETQLLSLFPFNNTVKLEDLSSLDKLAVRAETLLNMISATAHAASPTHSLPSPHATSSTSLASDLVKIFNNVWLHLSTTQDATIKHSIFTKWLPLLLTFTTIQSPTLFNPAPAPTPSTAKPTLLPPDNRAKLLLTLTALFLELQSSLSSIPSIPILPTLIEQTFDLALLLVDGLPDDARLTCIRSLKDVVADGRLAYLWSAQKGPSEWLVVKGGEKGVVEGREKGGDGARDGGKEREKERTVPFPLRRWEMLGEPTPNVGENDTSLSLTLFGARRG